MWNKIKLIVQGWWNLVLDFISDVRYKKYFDARYEICKVCDGNEKNFCKHCGCFLPAKTMSEDSECPIGKWKTIKDTLNETKA